MGRAREFLAHVSGVLKRAKTPQGKGKNSVALVGIASAARSGRSGARLAPQRIRQAFRESCGTNEAGRTIGLVSLESHVELDDHATRLAKETEGYIGQAYTLLDLGDLEFDEEDDADPAVFFDSVVELCGLVNSYNIQPIFLGGDRSLTWPAFYGLATTPRVSLGHRDIGDTKGGAWREPGDSERDSSALPTIRAFTAHPDLLRPPDGCGHAWPVESTLAHALESRLCQKILQYGVRCNVPRQTNWWQEFPQVEQYGAGQLSLMGPEELTQLMLSGLEVDPRSSMMRNPAASQVYLSIDLSCLEPSAAPAVGRPDPGGLSVRQMLHLISSMPRSPFLGADIVECCVDDAVDPAGATPRVAAKLLRELVPKLALRAGRQQKIDAGPGDPNKKTPLPWPW